MLVLPLNQVMEPIQLLGRRRVLPMVRVRRQEQGRRVPVVLGQIEQTELGQKVPMTI
jgi:hypothetical protein